MLHYLGVLQWTIKHFAWFFFKTMDVSGAEAVVAAASPFLGASESVCLVRPYIDIMTESELHLIMTSGEFFLFLEFDDHWRLNKLLLEVFLLLLAPS